MIRNERSSGDVLRSANAAPGHSSTAAEDASRTNLGAEFAAVVTPDAIGIVATTSRRLAAAAEEELRARYQLGAMLRVARAGESGGAHVLAAVAEALGVHPSLLRRYVRVATAIAPAQFDLLATMRNDLGMPMTWSHFEHLAEIRSAKMRVLMAEHAISNRLSVRALKRRVRRSADDLSNPSS
jgi:hypothetical protein